jgi:hypothetical protein
VTFESGYIGVKPEAPWAVIGIIDAYGAIHHRPIHFGDEFKTHDFFWPNQTHKRWRLIISEWQLENSILTQENKLTPEEAEDVLAKCRKHYKPPLWLIRGEEWDAMGRPRSGAAYERFERRWERIFARMKR